MGENRQIFGISSLMKLAYRKSRKCITHNGRKKVTDTTPKIDKVKELEEEELAKLVEMKDNLGENLPPRYKDADLLGFLRARSLNVKEGEKLLNLDKNLRLFLELDDMVQYYELSEVNKKYSASGIIGPDKDGCLVRVINIGMSDVKGYLHTISTIENFRLLLWYFEQDLKEQEAENRRSGKKNHQLVYILNLDQLSMSKITYKPAFDTALLAVRLLQDHFHDTPKEVFVVNAPPFFSSVFKMFKPVIGEDLHKKIHVFDGNGKEELLKHIDADVLPVYLGGNRKDSNGDPMCKEFIGFGGKIPEKYYSTAFLDPDDPDVTTVTVPAGSTVNFRFHVPEVGSLLKWHIQSKENDIGVGVYKECAEEETESSSTEKQKKKKEEDMSKLEQITPVIRSQCHICPEVGSTISWFKGIAVLHFDNTYSWMNSKEVMYKVTIEPPSNAESERVTSTAQAALKWK